MEKLKVYCMYDKKNDFYHSPGIGIDDKDFSKYLINQLDDIYNGLSDNQVENFVQHVREQKVVRLGYLDPKTGDLISDKSDIVDLASFRDKPLVPENPKVEESDSNEVQESV